MKVFRGNKPDITPAQVVGLVALAIQTAVAFGVHITTKQEHVLLADTGFVAALVFGDVLLRRSRNHRAAAEAVASSPVAETPPVPTPTAVADDSVTPPDATPAV